MNEWPSGGQSFDALIEVLTDMAGAQPSPEKRSRLQRMLEGAKAIPRDLAVNIGAAYLTKISGLG